MTSTSQATGQRPAGAVILAAESVTKTFTTPDGRALPVLDDVSFQLAEGEIVALLGKSGSGKSTLLRCIAGLIAPSMDTVTYSVGGLAGLLEILAARGGEDGLAELADELSFEIDDLLPLVDAAVLLGLARTENARIAITPEGKEFATADILTSKQLFARYATRRAPLVRAIVQALSATEDHTLREGFFLDLLRRGFSDEEARRQLQTAIDWGRYGEVYDFNADDGELTLEPGTQVSQRARRHRQWNTAQAAFR